MNNCVSNYLYHSVTYYGDKVAYKDKTFEVTFSEVNNMSGAIACELIKRGYFEYPVLVMLSRTVYTPICHLGVARSGCFYVPMDPANPILRLNQIVTIINSDIMIVDEASLEVVKLLNFKGQVLVLENIISGEFDPEVVLASENRIVGTMPLYVIFTSGSTGIPKGVTTSHHSLMCYIDAVSEILDITEDDNLANQSPMDYIAAVRDIYIPLKTGSSTLIVPSNEFAVPSALLETLCKNNISTICWSAAGLELCVKTGLFECGIPKSITKVMFSGSVLSGRALMNWQKALPDAKFVNQYGPTEATASCTYHIVTEKADENTMLPIGVPYDNYKIILLDEDNKTVGKGEIGEICVSGPTVTLGYYGNKEATNKAFIQNPLNQKYREIIYKTGDLGRYNDDGILIFCGRKDRQIKYLGHRIELEEIESYGRAISGVEDCVSVYDHNRTVLYFVYTGTTEIKAISLFFRKNLPSYMVPRKIVKLNKFPILPNGKINVKEVEKEILK